MPLIIFLCIAGLVVNIKVLCCTYWIRRPMSLTLVLSLSLAAADTWASFFTAVALIFNSWLKYSLPMIVNMIIEICRLCGLLSTVTHLLALSINHHLGIWKPLHFHSIKTSKKVAVLIAILWIFSPIFFVCYPLITGYQLLDSTKYSKFFTTFAFRITMAFLFFVPLIIMSVLYLHILVMVRKQQKVWSNLSRSGSTRWKAIKASSRDNVTKSQQQRQVEGNIKAIKTTLFILGSCVIGWMPATVVFSLMCDDGCPITGIDLWTLRNCYHREMFFVMLVKTIFLIAKSLVNPVIYTNRMLPIKVRFAVATTMCNGNTTICIKEIINFAIHAIITCIEK